MLDYFETNQPTLDIAALKREDPEVRWKTYEQWAATQDWDRILAQSAYGGL